MKKNSLFCLGIFLFVTFFGCTSEDTTTWNNINALEIPKYNYIAYGDGIYVAVGNDGIISTSTNAKDWDTVSSGTTSTLKYIIWDGKGFKAVGDKGVVLASTNGKKWALYKTNIKSDFSYLLYENNKYLAISNDKNEIDVSEDCKTWTPGLNDNKFKVEKIVYNGQCFAAIGGDVFSRKSYVYLSESGVNWERYSLGDYGKFTDVIIDNGIAIASAGFVELGKTEADFKIITSEDFKTWKEVTTNTMLITCISKTKGGYIYAAYNDLYLSDDLINWTKVKVSPEDEYINLFAKCNDYLFAIPDYSNNVYFSEYGSMWDYAVKAQYLSFQDVIWYDNKFIAISCNTVGPRQNAVLFASPDGTTWFRSQEKIPEILSTIEDASFSDDSIATNGKNSVKVDVEGLQYSDDSSDWKHIEIEEKNLLFTGVVWEGGRYLAYGSEGDGNNGIIYSSPDGITWRKMITNTENQINGIAWNGTKYVAVGYNGTILTYIPKNKN